MYPSDSSCQIIVSRRRTLPGIALTHTVHIDDVSHPQKLMVGTHVAIPLQPGRHKLRVTAGLQGSKSLEFEIHPGQQINFTCEGTALNLLHPVLLKLGDSSTALTTSQKLGQYLLAGQRPQEDLPSSVQPQDRAFAQNQVQDQIPDQGPDQIPDQGQGHGQSQGRRHYGAPAQAGMWQQPEPAAPGGWPAPQNPYGQQQPAGPVPLPEIIEYVETSETEEPLGQEVRIIDNRQSNTGVTRSVKASREWTTNLTVGTEKTRTLGAEVGFEKWLSVKGKIESELQRNYSMETGGKHLFEESLTITAPPRTTIRLVLHWKRVWQNGVVRLSHHDGTITEVPYKFVVNVTFDQSQQDTDSDPAPGA